MVDIQQEVVGAKAFFKNMQIPLSDEWLQSCISWYREEQKGAPYTEKELHSAVYDQWLSFDLREVELPQLPSNIQAVTKLVLNRTLALQVLTVVDISKPKLQQLNKIKNSNPLTRGIDEENTNNDNFTAKRMLQLTLTDGVQEIKAIEYKPVPALNVNLSPGIKIKIIGPVTIRRGTLMLEPHHVKLLGGEVEEILVSNAAENVLAQFLNLPQNPNPRNVSDSIIDVKSKQIQNVNTNYNIVNKQPVQTNISNYFGSDNKDDIVFIDDEDELRIAQEVDSLLESKSLTSEFKKVKPQEDEESRIAQEIDMLLETERDILAESAQQATPRKPTPLKPTKSGNFDDRNSPKLNESVDLKQSDLIDLKDEFFSFLEPDDQPTADDKIYTLSEVKRMVSDKRSGKYTTFAKFKSVVQKLTVDGEGWALQISIESDEDEVTVKMDNALVTEMVGYSPQEVLQMKKDIQEKNAATANLFLKALDGFRLKLLELNCLMEIEYKGGSNVPCIINLL